MINQPILYDDMPHPTDGGTGNGEQDGTGPFNERQPLKVAMANALMSIYGGEIPFLVFDNQDKTNAEEDEEDLTKGGNPVCDEVYEDDGRVTYDEEDKHKGNSWGRHKK